MTLQCFLGSVYVAVLDPILLAGLFNDGGDLSVMGLDDAWEEVVSSLVIQGSSEHRPEPAPCGIVLSRGDLQLCPKRIKICRAVGLSIIVNLPIHMNNIIFIWLRPFNLLIQNN